MPRFTIEGSPISIAYGYDFSCGIFLSVYDRRLMYNEKASCEVNEVAESIGVKDGGGSYFDLHTGPTGFGMKVSDDTMRVYLQRYGVPQKQIDKIFRENIMEDFYGAKKFENLSLDEPCSDKCLFCNNDKNKTCLKCKTVYSPCQICETKDWFTHKFNSCKCKVASKDEQNLKQVNGILLPVNSEKPVLTQIKVETKFDKEEDHYFESPCLKSFFGDNFLGSSMIAGNPLRKDKVFTDTLIIKYRDEFLKDGSKPNLLVRKLCKNKNPHDWRGPMLVLKYEGTIHEMPPSYIDTDFDDLQDIIDYFTWCGSNFPNRSL
jgi:hypothetical protein